MRTSQKTKLPRFDYLENVKLIEHAEKQICRGQLCQKAVATRGSTIDLSTIRKFYYNGCTSELKMAYAGSSKYSAGVEFSSRTELSGNTADHSFTIRTQFIDTDTSYATHTTIIGTGKSKKATSTDATVNFAMGYRTDNCGTSSNSTSCTLGTAVSFCAKNSGTTNTYALDTTTANCSTYNTTYSGVTALERSDLPNGYFAVTKAAFGL